MSGAERDLKKTHDGHQGATALLAGRATELSACSFPRAIAAMLRERSTGTLNLTLRQYEKSLTFRDGAPVFASSNIAEESLGRFLVKRGDLDETVSYQALARSVEMDRDVGEVLVEMGVLEPHALFIAMRRCLGACILDAFRWTEGSLCFDPREPDADGKLLLKVQAGSLILRGVCAFSPLSVIEGDFADRAEPHQVRVRASKILADLQLNTMEARVVNVLGRASHTVASLAEAAGVSDEMALRLMYALRLLSVVAPAAVVEAEAAADAAEAEKSSAEAVASRGEPRGADASADAPTSPTSVGGTPLTEEEKKAIDGAYLVAKTKSFYELLNIESEYSFAKLRECFVGACEKYSPMAYAGRELGEYRDRTEELLIVLARAFVTLADPTHRQAYDQRLAAQRARRQTPSAEQGAPEASATGPGASPTRVGAAAGKAAGAAATPKRAQEASPFAIKTSLLDARVHINNGTKLLNSKRYHEAMEHFQFACDVDPTHAAANAYLGYALYLSDPAENYRPAMHQLQKAMALDPREGVAYFLLGRVYEMQREPDDAQRAYEECLRCDPNHKSARAAVGRLKNRKGTAKE